MATPVMTNVGSDPDTAALAHEAGHAVMARLLGVSLGRIWINRKKESGGANADCLDEDDPPRAILILTAARACSQAFEIDTLKCQGGIGDETRILNILETMLPDEDENKSALFVN